MKRTRLLHCFACLLLLLGFSGCGDHRIPIAPGAPHLRIKTIIEEGPSSTTLVSAFRYDAQGRLSLIIGYQAPDSSLTPVENTVFQYNGQNQLTQARREIVRRAGSSPNPFELYQYGYNGAGLVSGVSFTSSSMGAVTRWNAGIQYNAANQAESGSDFFDIPGVTINGHSSYSYTGNNLTSVTRTQISNIKGQPINSTSTTTYAYDTNINPFYGTYVIPRPTLFAYPPSGDLRNNTYFGGLNFLSSLSQSNLLSGYLYTYNAANLPTKRVSGSETLYFEYENF